MILDKKIRYALWVIGSIGAIGEGVILYHYLVDCYPYKMMFSPSYLAYESVANICVVMGSLLSIAAPCYLKLRNRYLITTAQITISPLLFLFYLYLLTLKVFVENSILGFAQVRNFDGYTGFSVALEFTFEVASLLAFGIVISLVCSFIANQLDIKIGKK